MEIWGAPACQAGSLKIMYRVTKIKAKTLIFSCFFPLLWIHTQWHYECSPSQDVQWKGWRTRDLVDLQHTLMWVLRTLSLDIVLWDTEEWHGSEKLLRNGDSTGKLWGKPSFPWFSTFSVQRFSLDMQRPVILFQRTLQLTESFLAITEQCPVFSSGSNRLPALESPHPTLSGNAVDFRHGW